jgi:hypothetical protein
METKYFLDYIMNPFLMPHRTTMISQFIFRIKWCATAITNMTLVTSHLAKKNVGAKPVLR